MQGLLELIHYNFTDREAIKPSTEITNTMSHIGLIVPDIQATQERLDKFKDVKVFKRLGEDAELKGPIANAYGVGNVFERDSEEANQIREATAMAGTKSYIFLSDPDGNYIEVQGLEAPGGFSSG